MVALLLTTASASAYRVQVVELIHSTVRLYITVDCAKNGCPSYLPGNSIAIYELCNS